MLDTHVLRKGCARAAGEERMSGCYVVANPGAPFKTILKVNCAIAVPRVEKRKTVVNRASSGLRRASGLRKFCISYLPRDFWRMALQKLIRLTLFSCIVRGFSRRPCGTSVAVYLSDECRCETSKITRMRLYSTEIEPSGGPSK